MKTRGAVLPLVITVLFCITLMLTALMKLPGGVLRVERTLEKKLQAIYDAESQILLQLYGLPSHDVSVRQAGPWLELSSPAGTWGRVCVVAGRQYDSLSRASKRGLVERFRVTLNQEILLGKNIQTKSGNRRLFGPAQSMSLVVENGDLLVDVFGPAKVCNFKSYGTMTLRGAAEFDTLRVYSSGQMFFAGDLKINWLEAYSADRIEISGNVHFSGAAVANGSVLLRQHALAIYPSALLSLNAPVEYEPKNIADSLLLPAYEDDAGVSLVPFGWSLL